MAKPRKLSENDVIEIREWAKARKEIGTVKALARRKGVVTTVIFSVIRGHRYKTVGRR